MRYVFLRLVMAIKVGRRSEKRANIAQGYTLYLLTKHGRPEPWGPEEARDFVGED